MCILCTHGVFCVNDVSDCVVRDSNPFYNAYALYDEYQVYNLCVQGGTDVHDANNCWIQCIQCIDAQCQMM